MNYKSADPALHERARLFIGSMIRKVKLDYDISNIKTVNISRQVGKLDVLVEVNKGQQDKLAILVEDKTHTNNHSDQLNRYYKQIADKGYAESEMIPVYFKTGYQSRFDTLGAFKPYLRSDFLNVLRQGDKTGIANAIFSDFLAHLEHMEYVIRQFSVQPLDKWSANDWQGFYMTLYDNRHKINDSAQDDGANWNYVANPAGGFFGYWWYFKDQSGLMYVPYLQLEENCLTFKIKVDNESDRRNAREEACQRIIQASLQVGLEVSRPARMGNGRFMTVAYAKNDYRILYDGKIELDATMGILKKAQDIIDAAFRH